MAVIPTVTEISKIFQLQTILLTMQKKSLREILLMREEERGVLVGSLLSIPTQHLMSLSTWHIEYLLQFTALHVV